MIRVSYLNKSLKSYPSFSDIIDTENVKSIDCSFLKISNLDLTLFDFPNLTFFDCSFNNLNDLSFLNYLKSPNLETLIICNNKLTKLPPLKFDNLIYFECSHNNLTELPKFNLPKLTHFYCSKNNLTELPEINCPNLIHFNCVSNNLKKLTINSSTLVQLECTNNEIEELKINSPNLSHLYCSNNKLTTIPKINWSNIINININHNNLQNKIEIISPTLEIFYCYNNNFTELSLFSPSLHILDCDIDIKKINFNNIIHDKFLKFIINFDYNLYTAKHIQKTTNIRFITKNNKLYRYINTNKNIYHKFYLI